MIKKNMCPKDPTLENSGGSNSAQGDTSSNPTTQPTSASDARVGWVYQLRKTDLAAELAKFLLSTEGTVDDMRRRLCQFLREGANSSKPSVPLTMPPQGNKPPAPTPLPPVNPGPAVNVPPVPQPPMVSSIKAISKWNLSFDGSSDPVAFIERIEELRELYNIPYNQVLAAMSELLQGSALLWYRNNRFLWSSWEEFLGDFREYFLPADYDIRLEETITRRVQGPHEKGQDYLARLQTLLRRHGSMNHERTLYWLHRNLRPEVRQHVRRCDFSSVSELVALVKEHEDLQREIAGSRRGPSTVYTSSPLSGGDTAEPTPRTTRSTPSPRVNSTPANSAPVMSSISSPTTPAGRSPTVSRCFRCGQVGHFRQDCKNTPRLCCSRCGKTGIMSRDCRCPKSGN